MPLRAYKQFRKIFLPIDTIIRRMGGQMLELNDAGKKRLVELEQQQRAAQTNFVKTFREQSKFSNLKDVNKAVYLLNNTDIVFSSEITDAYNNMIETRDQRVKFLEEGAVEQGLGKFTPIANTGEYIADMLETAPQKGATQAQLEYIKTIEEQIKKTQDPVRRAELQSEIDAKDLEIRKQAGNVGFIRRKDAAKAKIRDKLIAITGNDLSTEEVQKAFEAAADDTIATKDMKKGSMERKLREFLEFDVYRDYLAKVGHGLDLGFLPNFWPRSLDLNEISARSQEFIDLIYDEKVKQGIDPQIYTDKKGNEQSGLRNEILYTVERMAKYNEKLLNDTEEKTEPNLLASEDEFGFDNSPYNRAEFARELTKNIDNKTLGSFLEKPDVALNTYLNRAVKRAEWRRATFNPDGTDKLGPLLNQLKKEDLAYAREGIQAYLGYVPKPIPNWLRTLNSYGQLFQFVTLLPFAAMASLPDLAGPLLNNKDWDGFVAALKDIPEVVRKTGFINQTKEFNILAKDLGIVNQESIASTLISQGEEDFMNVNARKLSNAFFTATGLTAFTNFSRAFATGMGLRFIIRHAATKPEDGELAYENSVAYLRELGLTQEQVNKALENAIRDEDGTIIQVPELSPELSNAVHRFAESSILRPNAAQRPLWASDPRFQLIWQLKSFAYAYGKTILGGFRNGVLNRVARDKVAGRPDEGVSQIPVSAAILVATTLPLTMLGLELREYTKSLLAFLIPGETHVDTEGNWKYLRSDRMDYGEYSWEMVKRSGILGYGALFEGASQASKYGDNFAISLLGPSAQFLEQVTQAVFSGNYENVIDRSIPLKSSI